MARITYGRSFNVRINQTYELDIPDELLAEYAPGDLATWHLDEYVILNSDAESEEQESIDDDELDYALHTIDGKEV